MVVESIEKNCVSYLDPARKLQSLCFDIFRVKLAFTDQGKKANFESLKLEVISSNFFLNKTSKFAQILPGSDFLIPEEKRGPRWGIIILVLCVVSLTIGLCFLCKHYAKKKDESFTVDSSMLSKKDTSSLLKMNPAVYGYSSANTKLTRQTIDSILNITKPYDVADEICEDDF